MKIVSVLFTFFAMFLLGLCYFFTTSSLIMATNVEILLFPTGSPARFIPAAPEYLDSKSQTIVIIHGWLDNGRLPWVKQYAQLYHKLGSYNVLSLDWSKIADRSYLIAQNRIKMVGIQAGDLIYNLLSKAGVDFDSVHLIGHSLGAHVGGAICERIKRTKGVQIGRLTGLEVARPLFQAPLPKLTAYKFDKRRARFVDAVHTNGGMNGISKNDGHVDFYINGGGKFQKGCHKTLRNLTEAAGCSHVSAHVYYAQALKNPGSLIGQKCILQQLGYKFKQCNAKETAELGEFTKVNASGAYFITTNNSPINV